MAEPLHIISLGVHPVSFAEALQMVMRMGLKREPAFVCFANAHMIVEAYRNKNFMGQLKKAELVLADGKPVSAACRFLYHQYQERISGMDFLPRILELANLAKARVFFYGSTSAVLDAARKKINTDYPDVINAGYISPPFRNPEPEETEADIQKINAASPNLVFLALGCPKQEQWMALHSEKINAILLGIGGALPVFAGLQKRAPRWMQHLALEWAFRLIQQPRRLFKRYCYTNFLFLFLLGRQWITQRFRR